ncbi:MAG: DUF4214 domain-containing protein [Pseudomonadota bacterium]
MTTFRVSSYSDPGGSFTSQAALVAALIEAAGQQIGQYLASNAVIDVAVTVDETITGSTIAQAGPAGVITEGLRTGGGTILETAAAAEIRSGVDQNGATAEINVTLTKLFFNQSSSYLGSAATVPAGKFDAISVLTHEMTHGIAFTGYLDRSDFFNNTVLPSSTYSDYDTQLISINNKPYFGGKVAEIVYGGPLPLLASGGSAIYHVDNTAAGLQTDLMAPVATNGQRVGLSDYDLAVYRDVGLPVTKTLTSPDGHTFVPGYGSVSVQGTSGLDTAVELGAHTGYNVLRNGSTVQVTGADGTDTLTSIERVQFDDATIALDIGLGEHGGEAYRLYQAAFNRQPDTAGLGFWIHSLDSGTPAWLVAQNFVQSQEFSSRYGALNTTAFVTQMYQNVLHRPPEAAGLTYYQNLLDSGLGTRQDVLLSFSESNENQTALIGTIQNGVLFTG